MWDLCLNPKAGVLQTTSKRLYTFITLSHPSLKCGWCEQNILYHIIWDTQYSQNIILMRTADKSVALADLFTFFGKERR